MKIQKAWTPEEKLKLANIRTLLDELMSAEAAAASGGEEAAPPPVEESVKKEEDESAPPPPPEAKPEEDVEKVKKAEEANADAEERMQELPPDDEEALSVLKSFIAATKSVKKAKPQQKESPEMQYIAQSLSVMKSMQTRLDEQGKTLAGILEGLGVTDEILKVEKAAPRQAVQPSANDILVALASVMKSAQTPSEPPKPEGMRDALKLLWGDQMRSKA